ncbi:MAG TPA: thioredoxin [Candidatus Omnitrophica bacterium]|nr:thioredoxin [Candidatus Omnitrophota bacterium]
MEVELTNQNFEEEIMNSSLPALVDFWAEWCGPCKVSLSHIEEIAKEYQGRLKVCKVNVDKSPEIAIRFSVMSIPTFMIFKEGKVMKKRVGAMSKEDLEKFIQPYL